MYFSMLCPCVKTIDPVCLSINSHFKLFILNISLSPSYCRVPIAVDLVITQRKPLLFFVWSAISFVLIAVSLVVAVILFSSTVSSCVGMCMFLIIRSLHYHVAGNIGRFDGFQRVAKF